MGIKERMMDGMMDKMSGEEKQKAVEAMMEKFMDGLSAEDKSRMMEGMMAKMMGEGGPMGMMRMMMGGGKGPESGSDPWDMCRKMMGAMTEGAQTARFATPEVRGLFDEWAAQIEDEMLQFTKESGEVDVDKVSARFKLSKDGIVYFLTRLAQKGKIKFGSSQEA
jgi:hypothetical protein